MRFLSLVLVCIPVYGADIAVFNPSTFIGVTNHSICYGPHPTRSVTNRVYLGTNTAWVITDITPATIAFIHATAWANGVESNPSNEILYTNHNFVPQTLIIFPRFANGSEGTNEYCRMFRVDFATEINYIYGLECSTNLLDWTLCPPEIDGTGQQDYFFDIDEGNRSYRLVLREGILPEE
jgi:hypothetical protein